MTTKTLRLPAPLIDAIRTVGAAEDIEESVALRKLLRMGYRSYVAGQYREGRITLRTAARQMGLSLSEALDALSGLGVPGNVSAADTLRSFRSAAAGRR